VRLETPADLPQALAELRGKGVVVDPAQSSSWYFEALDQAGARVGRAEDPCMLPRACKNPVEIEGTKRAHNPRRGGALPVPALVATEGQTNPPDEVEAVSRLEGFREETGR